MTGDIHIRMGGGDGGGRPTPPLQPPPPQQLQEPPERRQRVKPAPSFQFGGNMPGVVGAAVRLFLVVAGLFIIYRAVTWVFDLPNDTHAWREGIAGRDRHPSREQVDGPGHTRGDVHYAPDGRPYVAWRECSTCPRHTGPAPFDSGRRWEFDR